MTVYSIWVLYISWFPGIKLLSNETKVISDPVSGGKMT